VDCSGEEEELEKEVQKRREQGRRKRELRCSNIGKKKEIVHHVTWKLVERGDGDSIID
jgi:hypothetical protein